MTSHPFSALLAALDEEHQALRALADPLDHLLEAARTRDLSALTTSAEEVAALGSRARSAEVRRATVLDAFPRTARSLATIAALPGAPADSLLARREELRHAVDGITSRARRLAPLLRTLGEAYAGALAVVLQGATRDSRKPAGALVDAEA
ncbi:MAG TPA: hypothetical protein VKE69_05590 [Planctomycetota bacterium]|nr:hypothetical protein [Planctomycetota bacterium]